MHYYNYECTSTYLPMCNYLTVTKVSIDRLAIVNALADKCISGHGL